MKIPTNKLTKSMRIAAYHTRYVQRKKLLMLVRTPLVIPLLFCYNLPLKPA